MEAMPTGKLVRLRPPAPGDAAELIRLGRASEKFHRGLMRMARTEEDFAAFLERAAKPDNACFLIVRRADDAIAGTITLSQIFYGPFCNAYLGYGLGVGFTGGGLMTEAVRLVLRHAFKDLGLHRVEANVQPDNAPSIAVLERCGFSREGFSPKYLKIGGRWRDHARYAIVKENWQAGGTGKRRQASR